MGEYRLTLRGKIALAIIAILAVLSVIMGSIYLAVFIFAFCSIALALTIYEVFFNK